MRAEIWSEITCPWCGLGSHRLDRAVERFEHGDEIGLEREKTRRVLTEGRFTQQVQDDLESARRLGATGAPHIVVDGRYALPGAQDTDTLLGILRQVWDETHPTVLVADNDAATCGPDGCAVPAGHAAHA